VTGHGKKLNLPLVACTAIFAAVLLWVGIVALHGWSLGQFSKEHQKKFVEQPFEELEEQLSVQKGLLEKYQMVNRETGEVRLSIDKAMELVVEENGEERP